MARPKPAQADLDAFFDVILAGESKTYSDHNWYAKDGIKIHSCVNCEGNSRKGRGVPLDGYYDTIQQGKDLKDFTIKEVTDMQNRSRSLIRVNLGKRNGTQVKLDGSSFVLATKISATTYKYNGKEYLLDSQNGDNITHIGQLWAAGRYQMIPGDNKYLWYAASAAIQAGLVSGWNDKFNKENQDAIAYNNYFRNEVMQYIHGEVSDTFKNIESAALGLARVWSSIGVPYGIKGLKGWVTRNRSFYGEDGGGNARVSTEKAQDALRNLRKSLGHPIATDAQITQMTQDAAARVEEAPAENVSCAPFTDKKEADNFRTWLNEKYPNIAADVPSLPQGQSDRKVDKSGRCNSPNLLAAAEYQVDGKKLIEIFRANPTSPPTAPAASPNEPIAQNRKQDEPNKPKPVKRLSGQIARLFKNTLKPSVIEIELASSNKVNQNLIARSIGVSPNLFYNGVMIEPKDLRSFKLYHEGIVPKIEATIYDTYGIFKNTGKPADDTKISLYIDSKAKQLASIRIDFKIILFKQLSPGTYILQGLMDIPKLYSKGTFGTIPSSSSFTALQEIAKQCGLGFATNIAETNDSQTWISTGQSYLDLIKKIISKSYISDDSFQICYIDYYYNLVYTDLTTEFKRFVENDAAITGMGFDKMTAGTGQTEIDDKVERLLLTTDRNLNVSTNFIEMFKPVNNSTAISVSQGYSTDNKVLNTSTKELTYFNIQSQTDDTDKSLPLRANSGDDQFYKENKQSSYGGKIDAGEDGNTHTNSSFAAASNKRNFYDLIKLTATANLPNYNFNLYPYRKVPVAILLPAATPDQQQGFDEKLSGNWLIMSIEYHWKNSAPKMLLNLAKRSVELAPDQLPPDTSPGNNQNNNQNNNNPSESPTQNQPVEQQQQQNNPTNNPTQIKPPVRILFVGDSVTDMTAPNGQFTNTYPNKIKQKRPNLTIEQVAVGGWTTIQMIEGSNEALGPSITGTAPSSSANTNLPPQDTKQIGLRNFLKNTSWDRIYIYGGINDMFSPVTVDKCLSNIQTLVDLSVANGAQAYVILGYNVDGIMIAENMAFTAYVKTADGFRPFIQKYKDFQSKITKTIKNATFVPVINIDGLSSDGFHPNDKGHEIIANEIIKTIDNTSATSPVISKPSITTEKPDSDRKRLLFIGDSLTAGGNHPTVIKSYFGSKSQSKSPYYKCIVDVAAVGGWSTTSMLNGDINGEGAIAKLNRYKYDKIYMYGGINDTCCTGQMKDFQNTDPVKPKTSISKQTGLNVNCSETTPCIDPLDGKTKITRNGGPGYLRLRKWPPKNTPTDVNARRAFLQTKALADKAIQTALNNNQKVVDLGHKNGAKVYIIEGFIIGQGGCYEQGPMVANYNSPYIPLMDWENSTRFTRESYEEFRRRLPLEIKGADGFIKPVKCNCGKDGIHGGCSELIANEIKKTLQD
jgi:lysophospholipase L1-like esterase